MPITHSAAKRLRQSVKRSERNSLLRSKLDQAKKTLIKIAKRSDVAAFDAHLRSLTSIVDTMQQKGVLKRNAAARVKSRMAKILKRFSS